MNFLRSAFPRFSRGVKRFGASLMTTLAAMALTACDAGIEPVAPASSIARGVQQILHSSGPQPLLSSHPLTGKQS